VDTNARGRAQTDGECEDITGRSEPTASSSHSAPSRHRVGMLKGRRSMQSPHRRGMLPFPGLFRRRAPPTRLSGHGRPSAIVRSKCFAVQLETCRCECLPAPPTDPSTAAGSRPIPLIETNRAPGIASAVRMKGTEISITLLDPDGSPSCR